MTEIQKKLLIMLEWFHNYCVKNNYTYYIVGGSMLGAVRHGGFIPWDDDIDVVLPRPDYDRLISSFSKNNEGYILESPYSGNEDYYYSYAKLYDTGTTLVEKSKHPCRRGLYIDIFPLDGIGNSTTEVKRNFKKVDLVNKFLMTRVCMIDNERSRIKNVAIVLSNIIPSTLIDAKKLSVQLDRIASRFDYNNSIYVANLMGSYGNREIVEKRVFGAPTIYKFENIYVFGVEHYDEFLKHIYGNWQELPPKDKQKTRHDYVEIDLNKSYLEEKI